MRRMVRLRRAKVVGVVAARPGAMELEVEVDGRRVAAGAKAAGADRVVYVMTDGAALPGAFSRLVPRLRDVGLVDAFVTCGQAFGGELEAVTVWTGLLAAKEIAAADVIVVADGPGNLGTETRFGVSALGSGAALNAAG